MRLHRVTLILFCLFASNLAFAEQPNNVLSAWDLLSACTRADESWIEFCNGYMQATQDFGAASGVVCVTPGTTRTDLSVLYEHQAAVLFFKNPSMKNEPGLLVACSL